MYKFLSFRRFLFILSLKNLNMSPFKDISETIHDINDSQSRLTVINVTLAAFIDRIYYLPLLNIS